MKIFNVRVYALIRNESNEILVSDENRFGKKFTKFPGGGVDWGEGTKEALIREIKEEIGVDIVVGELFYLTDFFQVSAWSNEQQIISAYYWVSLKDFTSISVQAEKRYPEHDGEYFRWISMHDFSQETVDFPIDKVVVKKINGMGFNLVNDFE